MSSALSSHPTDRPEPPDAAATASAGSDALSVGPGETADSVLSWAMCRAASRQWSLLRPAEVLAAEVHPDDPLRRERILRQARRHLGFGASQPPDRQELRALATLSVAINLSAEQGRDLLEAAPDTARLAGPGSAPEAPARETPGREALAREVLAREAPGREALARRAPVRGGSPVGREPYPRHPDYFIG